MGIILCNKRQRLKPHLLAMCLKIVYMRVEQALVVGSTAVMSDSVGVFHIVIGTLRCCHHPALHVLKQQRQRMNILKVSANRKQNPIENLTSVNLVPSVCVGIGMSPEPIIVNILPLHVCDAERCLTAANSMLHGVVFYD